MKKMFLLCILSFAAMTLHANETQIIPGWTGDVDLLAGSASTNEEFFNEIGNRSRPDIGFAADLRPTQWPVGFCVSYLRGSMTGHLGFDGINVDINDTLAEVRLGLRARLHHPWFQPFVGAGYTHISLEETATTTNSNTTIDPSSISSSANGFYGELGLDFVIAQHLNLGFVVSKSKATGKVPDGDTQDNVELGSTHVNFLAGFHF